MSEKIEDIAQGYKRNKQDILKESPPRDHPSLDIVSTYGTKLEGKKMVLCVSGSVAIYKSIELARLLMRHGALVTCVASKAATKLIHPEYFRWATGHDVITELTGDLEHVRLADYNTSDMIIAYPATANTLGRLANGMDDTPVSTVMTVGFGSGVPIMVCPAMHEAMYENPAVKKNLEFLKGKVDIVEPQIIEGKAKIQEPAYVVNRVLEILTQKTSLLFGKNVLIIAGSTIEFIDPVRVITSQSTGRTGVLLAKQMITSGAKVSMVYGPGVEEPPAQTQKVIRVTTAMQMAQIVKNELVNKWDIIIMAAAVSDYTPQSPYTTKIKSGKDDFIIKLKKVPKIIDMVKKADDATLLVGFKAEVDVSVQDLEKRARAKLVECKADIIVANDIGKTYKKDPQSNNVLVIHASNGKVVPSGYHKKEEVVEFIISEIEQVLRDKLTEA